MNQYAAYMGLLGFGDPSALRQTLVPFGEAIEGCKQRVDELKARAEALRLKSSSKGEDPESHFNEDAIADMLMKEEMSRIEVLIGAAFVVCQTEITTVVSRVNGLHLLHGRHSKEPLTTTGRGKGQIVHFGPTKSGTPYTAIEFIDAFANYYKHRDEWRGEWDRLERGEQRHTAEVIQVAGLRRGASDNLRKAAVFLHNPNLSELSIFTDPLDEWAAALEEAYTGELHRRGVIRRASAAE